MRKLDTSCIIDDDPIFIYGTKRIMKEVDFCNDILVYNNGQDAIDGLNELTSQGKELPSVIFLDLNMPIMNGWEFLDDFTKIPNHNREKVTVYIISSSVDPRDLERIKDYEVVNNYILKPISPKDLENILDSVA
ncbi:response regulator [Costertonia aggregata]|uniref:Response regulator n=1 Tax=Costertonia aggregata TaxID=343403 RepID=A0A7H9AQ18_9FLAO|nr:response regulator [Costertonia aggregata]QLG45571.1 response regulator [Costertonia aggregata]